MPTYPKRTGVFLFFCLFFASGSLLAGPKPDSLRVLFIGNSYTYGNDLPELLAQLMTAKGIKVGHESVTTGGATLQKHWEEGKAQAAIHRKAWDFVVLQEQSVRPFTQREAFFKFARLLDAEIRKTGAKPLFYATWAAKAKPDEQPKLTEAYQTIGTELGSLVAPVGEAWKRALSDSLRLHGSDGRHPNLAGSYLAGCMLYRTMTRKKAARLPRQVIRDGKPSAGLSEKMARTLQKIADKTPLNQ